MDSSLKIILQIILQIVLIVINAFFASTEMALVSINKNKLKKDADEGNKTAIRLYKISQEPAGFLSTIQIGITLAGFLGSALAANTFAIGLSDVIYNKWGWTFLDVGVWNTISLVLITIILSYFTLVFGELVPKRIGLKYSYSVAKFTYGPVYFLSIIVKPFVWFLTKSSNLFLKIFKINTKDNEEIITEDEIKMYVDMSEKSGEIEDVEKKWIKNIFEFNDTIVREIMTPVRDIVYIKEDISKNDLIDLVRDTGFSRYPVVKNDLNEIQGILAIKDLFINNDKDLKTLFREPLYIPETTLADDLFKELQSSKNHIAIVVDEYGTCSGLITLEDLIEEIVGNIYDEFDRVSMDIEKKSDNTYIVSGKLSVFDFNEITGQSIEEDEAYDTIGGLIFSMIKSIPTDGSTILVNKDNITFKVLQLNKRRIEKVLVTIDDMVKENIEIEDKK